MHRLFAYNNAPEKHSEQSNGQKTLHSHKNASGIAAKQIVWFVCVCILEMASLIFVESGISAARSLSLQQI